MENATDLNTVEAKRTKWACGEDQPELYSEKFGSVDKQKRIESNLATQ